MKALVLATVAFLSVTANAMSDYSGVYGGTMNGEMVRITIEHSGETMTARLATLADSKGLLANCGATLGEMIDIDIDEEDGVTTVDSADFRFNSGNCHHIIGTRMLIDFKHKNGAVVGMETSVLLSSTTNPGRCFPTHPGGWYCEPDHINHEYLEGILTK